MRAFVLFDLVFSMTSQEIDLGTRLQNDLFCVEWDIKPQLINQSLCDEFQYYNNKQLKTEVDQHKRSGPSSVCVVEIVMSEI